MDLDKNKLLHLPESIFRGDWVYHLHQRQCQVSHTLILFWFYQYRLLWNIITQWDTAHNETLTLSSGNIHDCECLSIHSSSCTLTATPFEKSLTDYSLPTSHSSAPTSDCGAVETQHRIPSLPPPPQGVRCPPPWATAAQTALLLCSALGRWPPGETRPDLTIPPTAWENKGFYMGDYCYF